VILEYRICKVEVPYEGFRRTEAIRRKRQYEPAHLVHLGRGGSQNRIERGLCTAACERPFFAQVIRINRPP
jgi:hypothetical protein